MSFVIAIEEWYFLVVLNLFSINSRGEKKNEGLLNKFLELYRNLFTIEEKHEYYMKLKERSSIYIEGYIYYGIPKYTMRI